MSDPAPETAATARTMRWTLVVFALASFVWAGVLGLESKRFLQDSALVTGVVVSTRADSSTDEIAYVPTIEYRTRQGRTLRAEPVGSLPTTARANGSPVDLRYALSSPETIKLDNWFALWGGAGFLAFMGMVFLAVLWAVRPRR